MMWARSVIRSSRALHSRACLTGRRPNCRDPDGDRGAFKGRRQAHHLRQWRERGDGVGYVCPGYDGPRTRDWRNWFEKGVHAAGIQNPRWHDLRHTFASRLVMAGVPLRTVQVLMGHKRIETTLRYSHLGEAHLYEAVERLTQNPTATSTVGQLSATCIPRRKSLGIHGAQERIRTSTPLRALDPESSASASSATWAQCAVRRGKIILPAARGIVNAGRKGPIAMRKGHCMTRTVAVWQGGATA